MLIADTECGIVKCRHQRSTLASGRNIAPPEVGDNIYPGQFGEQKRIANLQCVTGLRVVTDSLAVASDGSNGTITHARLQ